MFVFEIRDNENRLVGWVFKKQLAQTWARIFEGTWKAVESGPYERFL